MADRRSRTDLYRRGQPPQPGPALGAIRATNPCGRQPLLPFEACNLGSINLAAFCNSITDRRGGDQVRWEALRSTVELAVRFLDDVIEGERISDAGDRGATRATRKIGLGVMGFADMLFNSVFLTIPEQALELADRLGSFIRSRLDCPASGWRKSVATFLPGVAASGNGPQRPVNAERSRGDDCPTGRYRSSRVLFRYRTDLFPGIPPACAWRQDLIEVNPIFEAAYSPTWRTKQIQRSLDYAATRSSIQDLASIPSR